MKINIRDYWILCKPRVVMLMLFTATVGMYLAIPFGHSLSFASWLATMSGIALLASSAASVNHILERNLDVIMTRTQRRPLAAGRIPVRNAWLFTVVLACIGWCILFFFVNFITALVTLLNALGYAFFYTLYLKPKTPQNIVIGGLFGAMPPLLGWLAVRGSFALDPLILVTLIFTWTPMHFWTLAIYYYKDYVGMPNPMLPVTHGIFYTKMCILLYSLFTIVVSLLIFAVGICGWLYASVAIILGVILLIMVGQLLYLRNEQLALSTFFYSMVYLFLLFLAMALDHYLII